MPWLATSPSAQATGLSGWQLKISGRDPALAAFNPAMLNAETRGVAHVSQDFLRAGASRSLVAGAGYLKKFEVEVGGTLQYVGFGDFVGRDERGVQTGDFNAREYAAGLAFAKTLDERVRVGIQLGVLGGSLEQFSSFGAFVSAGITYSPDTAGRTLLALQLQNAGVLFNSYTEQRDPLPSALSLGLSRRLRYLPLRVGLLYRRLDRWDILYDDPDRQDMTSFLGEDPEERSDVSRTLDNFARHLSLNAELSLGKKEVVQLRVGYDHQRQREAKVNEFLSLAGFSYGLGINLRRFRLDYGHGIQHLGGGPHHVGLLFDFGA